MSVCMSVLTHTECMGELENYYSAGVWYSGSDGGPHGHESGDIEAAHWGVWC